VDWTILPASCALARLGLIERKAGSFCASMGLISSFLADFQLRAAHCVFLLFRSAGLILRRLDGWRSALA